MMRKWKVLAAAAAALLMVGAGCATDVQPGASVQTGTENAAPAPQPTEAPPTSDQAPPAQGGPSSDVDATVDAALKEVDADSSASMQESADANLVGNDSAELNAYGQAYDQSQL